MDSLAALDARPLVSVFLPERLELVKGAPAARRAHLDQVVAALWPARAGDARRLLPGARAAQRAARPDPRGASGPGALDAWDAELAREGIALMEDRAEALDGPARRRSPRLADAARPAGAGGGALPPALAAADAAGLAAELAERRSADLERGFTAHGPHRDELVLQLDGVALRAYGSQGQQRTALLALLFAERELLAARRGRPPLMLLDDVMSELDAERRELLADLLRSGGQAVVTATEADHVPARRTTTS